MSNKIKIKSSEDVTGGPDRSDLIGCYFLLTSEPGKYIFFDDHDTPIVTDPMPVRSGESFTFSLDGDTWIIPDPKNTSHPFEIGEVGLITLAKGSWRSFHHKRPHNHNHDHDDDGDGESGTFQAQSGPRVGLEDAVSAAKA